MQWTSGHPHLAFNADTRDIALDQPLYHLLPESVRRAWDELKPDGTVDVHVKFEGDADSLSLDAGRHNPSIATPISIVDAPVFEVVIRPRDLSVGAAIDPLPARSRSRGGDSDGWKGDDYRRHGQT